MMERSQSTVWKRVTARTGLSRCIPLVFLKNLALWWLAARIVQRAVPRVGRSRETPGYEPHVDRSYELFQDGFLLFFITLEPSVE